MLDNWQRIDKIIKWSKSRSVKAFAESIGLAHAENLYRIKREQNGISRDVAEKIVHKYPELNKAWILIGSGDMFNKISSKLIPFYEIDIVELLTPNSRPGPTLHLDLPMFSGSDLSAISYGDAMSPVIPSGSIVIIKQISVDKIYPGEDYFILSTTFVGIRKVRQDIGGSMLRLEPRNRVDYDDILLEIDNIKELYLVKGIIIKK